MIKKQKDNIAGKRNERRKKKKNKPIFHFQHIESLITSLSH
jgi:hypothetical protein